MIKNYLRSSKFIAPMVIFVTLTILVYVQRGLDYHTLCSVMLVFSYIATMWFTANFLFVEDITQQQLTILHFGSSKLYYLFKIVSIWIWSELFNVIFIINLLVMVIVSDSRVFVNLLYIIFGFTLVSLLGVSITALFSLNKLKNSLLVSLIIVIIIIFSIVKNFLLNNFDVLQSFKLIFWLFPPMYMILDFVPNSEQVQFDVRMFLIPLIYSVIIISIYVFEMDRRKF
jgi:hypothetical protein